VGGGLKTPSYRLVQDGSDNWFICPTEQLPDFGHYCQNVGDKNCGTTFQISQKDVVWVSATNGPSVVCRVCRQRIVFKNMRDFIAGEVSALEVDV
jgi:DNA-directed RNA polymerase subunit RPC12/RpoP